MAKLHCFRVLDIRHLKRGMPKMNKRYINVFLTKGNQFNGFQEVREGNLSGLYYTHWVFEAFELEWWCSWCYAQSLLPLILGWPKSLFRFFHNTLQKTTNKLSGWPGIRVCMPKAFLQTSKVAQAVTCSGRLRDYAWPAKVSRIISSYQTSEFLQILGKRSSCQAT